MWYRMDGDTVVMNTAKGRTKAINLYSHPDISVCVADGYRFLTLQGTATIDANRARPAGNPDNRSPLCRPSRNRADLPDTWKHQERITIEMPIDHVIANGFELAAEPNDMIVTLAGGVGGARFSDGVAQIARRKTGGIVNTAETSICTECGSAPISTPCSTTSPVSPIRSTAGASPMIPAATLDGIAEYGEEPWFLLGDRDFATHILRTSLAQKRQTLTCGDRFVAHASWRCRPILPMTDERSRHHRKPQRGTQFSGLLCPPPSD